MARTSQPSSSSSPFARLSRLGVGLGLKSQPSPTFPVDQDEDWYIAYNGPYEVPKDMRKRDSWGDVVEEEGRDSIIDADLIRRYGGGSGYLDSAGYRRGRAQSATTLTSGPTEGDRRSVLSQRHSSNIRRAPVSSYINLDAAGGVGDSPMPPQRTPVSPSFDNQAGGNRTSVADFFFGRSPSSSSKKLARSPSTNNMLQCHGESRRLSSATRKSTSLDMPRSWNQGPVLAIETKTSPLGDDDYYNSYYSTLLSTPKSAGIISPRDSRPNIASTKPPGPEPIENASSRASLHETHRHPASTHPYTYTFPVQRERALTHIAPQTAPPVTRAATSPLLQTKHNPKDSVSSSSHQNHRYPAQALIGTKNSVGSRRVAGTLKPTLLVPLKSSVSTPNLRRGQLTQSPLSPQLPKGMDRWFSAESWCDAMILPRPRFKVNNGPGDLITDSDKRANGKSSGRIVSPPLTPIAQLEDGPDMVEKQSFPERREQIAMESATRPRRRLTKSKSATSLRSPDPSTNPTRYPGPSMTVSPAGRDRIDHKGKAKLQKRRPKNLVLDDLALQGEPSLDRCVIVPFIQLLTFDFIVGD